MFMIICVVLYMHTVSSGAEIRTRGEQLSKLQLAFTGAGNEFPCPCYTLRRLIDLHTNKWGIIILFLKQQLKSTNRNIDITSWFS